MSIDTEGIAALAAFLNAHNGDEPAEMTAQMLKLAEETGEASAAWIGYLGQNPRKGVTHSLDDMLSELADVAITAMVGIARLGGDPSVVVGGKVAVMRSRYAELPAQPAEPACPNPDCRNGKLPPPRSLQGIARMILCPDCNPQPEEVR